MLVVLVLVLVLVLMLVLVDHEQVKVVKLKNCPVEQAVHFLMLMS